MQTSTGFGANAINATPPACSVVICTRNRAEIIGDCIESLAAQSTDFPVEIVVIDDGSTDGTGDVVAALADTNPEAVIRHVPQEHGGVNAARSNGIVSSRGDVVLFFDDDEVAPPDYLAKVMSALDADPDLAGVGGPYRDLGRGGPRTCATCNLASVDVPGSGRRESDRLLGGNMAIRRRVFDEVGLFDVQISGRGDEVEWFDRARDYRFVHDPDLWVWHRRDHMTWAGACRHAFRQGRSVPLHFKKTGLTFRPRIGLLIRSTAHGVLQRCTRGFVVSLRELGALSAWMGIGKTRLDG